MHMLSATTCAIHNSSLAKAFGGALFAKTALRPAVIAEITDEKERGRVVAAAWNNYNRINIPAHLLFTATWLMERRGLRHLHVDHRTQKLIAIKDVLIAGALVTGMANVIAGRMIQQDYPDGVPVSDKPTTDPKLERYRRFFRVMGPAHIIFTGTALATGAAIGVGVVRSLTRRFVDKLLE